MKERKVRRKLLYLLRQRVRNRAFEATEMSKLLTSGKVSAEEYKRAVRSYQRAKKDYEAIAELP